MKYVFLTKGKTTINIGPERGVFPIGYINRAITQTSMLDDMLEDTCDEVEETKEKIRLLCVYSPADVADMQTVTNASFETIEYLENQITKYNTLALMRIMMQEGYDIECRELTKEESNA